MTYVELNRLVDQARSEKETADVLTGEAIPLEAGPGVQTFAVAEGHGDRDTHEGTNPRAEHDSPRIATDWHARVDVRARP